MCRPQPHALLQYSCSILKDDEMRLGQISRPCYLTASFLRKHPTVRMTMTATSTMEYPALIDVDCNLWHKDLQTLQPNQNQEGSWTMLNEDAIGKANIIGMLSPSSTLMESRGGLQCLMAQAPPIEVRTTVGVHPYHVNDGDEAWLAKANNMESSTMDDRKEAMLSLLRNPDHRAWIAAIGECGLDASDGFPPIDEQLPWFQFQIEVAEEFQLPLFVHERLAFQETMKLLEKVTVPTIIHCFTGTQEECRAYVERGFYLSVSGYILKNDEGSQEVRKCLESGVLPLNRLMVETDSPYMGFPGCRKLYVEHNTEYMSTLNSKKKKKLEQSFYPNVPSSLPQVLTAVSDCLKEYDPSITREAVARTTTMNAQSFFGFTSKSVS
jgi:TatD DNase family protein